MSRNLRMSAKEQERQIDALARELVTTRDELNRRSAAFQEGGTRDAYFNAAGMLDSIITRWFVTASEMADDEEACR